MKGTFTLEEEYAAASAATPTSSGGEIKSSLSRKDETVSVRKILNGYIARSSWVEGEGEKREWKEEEKYYPENPL